MALLTLENNVEDYLKNIEIETFSESMTFKDCVLSIVAESERMWNDIIKEMAITELQYVAENGGAQMVYESVDVKGFFDKVIDFFKKIGAKIAGFFKKVFEWIEDHLDTNKAFVKKYEKAIRKGHEKMANDGHVKISKWYNYKNIENIRLNGLLGVFTKLLNSACGYDKVLSSYTTTDEIKEKLEVFDKGSNLVDDTLDKARALIVNNTKGKKAVSSSEFKEVATNYLRGDEFEEKVYKGDINIDTLIDDISKCVKMKRACKESYNSAKKELNEMIKDMNRYKKEIDKDDANKELKLSYAKGIIQILKGAISICTTMRGIHVTAYKDRCKQSKAIATKLVEIGKKAEREEKRAKEKEKNKKQQEETETSSVNDSFSFQSEDNFSFFTSDLL